MMPDPRECKHVLAIDDASHTAYCIVCAWWWDTDFETPPPRGNHGTDVILNPDNEPTSEHMQWSEDNDRA